MSPTPRRIEEGEEAAPRRRATDKSPLLNGVAAQVKALTDFVNSVAVAPLIVIVFLGMYTGYIRNPASEDQKARAEEHRVHAITLASISAALEVAAKNARDRDYEQRRLNRWIMVGHCNSMSEKENLRSRCLAEWDRIEPR